MLLLATKLEIVCHSSNRTDTHSEPLHRPGSQRMFSLHLLGARPIENVPNSSMEQKDVLKITCGGISVLLRHKYPDSPDTSHVLFFMTYCTHSMSLLFSSQSRYKKAIESQERTDQEAQWFHLSRALSFWDTKSRPKQRSHNLLCMRITQRACGKRTLAAPPISDCGYGVDPKNLYFYSSQERMMLLILGPHFENHQPRKSPRLPGSLLRR